MRNLRRHADALAQRGVGVDRLAVAVCLRGSINQELGDVEAELAGKGFGDSETVIEGLSLLFAEEGLGVCRIDLVFVLAGFAELGFAVAGYLVGENKGRGIKILYARLGPDLVQQFTFCLVAQVHLGQRRSKALVVGTKTCLFVTDNAGLW